MERTLIASTSVYMRGFIYFGCLFFLGAISSCFVLLKGGNKLIGFCFFPFFLIGAVNIFCFGSVSVNNHKLVSRCWLGSYGINWDEIEHVWFDGAKLNILAEGNGKRVAIPGPAILSGQDKKEMVALVRLKLAERGIKPRLSSIKTILLSNKAAKIP